MACSTSLSRGPAFSSNSDSSNTNEFFSSGSGAPTSRRCSFIGLSLHALLATTEPVLQVLLQGTHGGQPSYHHVLSIIWGPRHARGRNAPTSCEPSCRAEVVPTWPATR